MIRRIGIGQWAGRRATVLTVLSVLLSGWSFAQSAPDPELVAAVAGRTKVRVLTSRGRLVLHGPEATEDGLAYRVGGRGERRGVVPWADVAGLQVRRSGAGKGALIGAGIGAACGLAIGLASTGECDEWLDMFCGASAGDVILATVGGGAVYGLLGALIGNLAGRWSTVYTRGASPQKIPFVSVAPAPGGGFVLSLSMNL